ncbi:MAG: fasciclin domain-containing protein [Rhodobacteraceae bacterium]|nr:fasciclin domain-containing protein [Paracoccaceae bacterium]
MATIYATLGASSDTEIFKTLIDLVDASPQGSNLAGLLSDLGTDTTVFIPTDAAFVSLAQSFGFSGTDEAGALDYIIEVALLIGKGDPWTVLSDMLTYHMTAGIVVSGNLATASPLTTLNGADLDTNGTTFTDNDADTLDANLVGGEQLQDNGILYTLDEVLLPSEFLPSNGANDVDLVIGTDSADYISVGADNDYVNADDGSDTIDLGAGNDVGIGWCGNDTIFGGTGDDYIMGGNSIDIAYGGEDSDTLDGGNGNDILWGEDGADILDGGNDDDYLDGGGSSDLLMGGNGHDTVVGGAGNDTLFGGSGNDWLQGGSGGDSIYGEFGDDTLTGNSGNDLFVVANGAGNDLITDFQSGDRIDLSAFGIWDFSTLALTQIGSTTTLQLDANDSITLLGVGIANLTAADFVFAAPPPPPTGTDSADTITTGDTNDVIYAGGGSDKVSTGGGNDTIYGESGQDDLRGGSGNDLIDGGSGKDKLYGGTGNDTLLGQADNDVMLGEDGNDLLNGGNANDRIYGGAGNDSLIGANGNDKLYGDGDNDTLDGGSGKDILVGGSGDDRLIGGQHNDTLTGGSGADTFVFIADSRTDTVKDFENGTDLLDVTVHGYTDISDLSVSQDGLNVLIELGDGSQIILENTALAALDNADFIF